ncbi:MAG: magnesium transporter [Beijerinckiaceae bacterium]|nr:magnesium transporter [Beijerinckiaceae bacterium]
MNDSDERRRNGGLDELPPLVREPIHDAEGALLPSYVAAIQAAIIKRDANRLRELAGDIHESDLGALIEALPTSQRAGLISIMGRDFDFAALTEVDDTIREDILEELPAKDVARYVQDLESDDAVALLEDLDKEDQDEILQAMPPIDRAALQRSLDFPEKSAGRLMQTTLVTVPPFWTAGQAVDTMRDADEADLPDEFFEIFIVDPGHRLLGNVFLDALMRAKPSKKLSEIMRTDRRRVKVTDEAEDVAELFERYNLVSAPVVDEADRLVGVITIDDIVDVIRAEADQEIKNLGGVSASETLSDPMWLTARSRFLWLLVNLVTAFIASSVLGAFENQLQKMVALAVLAPIVASQGGNGATQTMTVVIRALATHELSRYNALRVIGRELVAGALNGVAFGVITGIGATIWFGAGGLGFVIAAAMLTNLVAGALGGILVPLLLDRLDIDPAVSASAFVTTVTDVVGYFSFLGFATLWFHLA